MATLAPANVFELLQRNFPDRVLALAEQSDVKILLNKIAVARRIIAYWLSVLSPLAIQEQLGMIFIDDGQRTFKIVGLNKGYFRLSTDNKNYSVEPKTCDPIDAQSIIDAYTAMQSLPMTQKIGSHASSWYCIYLCGSSDRLGFSCRSWNSDNDSFLRTRLFDHPFDFTDLKMQSMSKHELDEHHDIMNKIPRLLLSKPGLKLTRDTIAGIPGYCGSPITVEHTNDDRNNRNTSGRVFKTKTAAGGCYSFDDNVQCFLVASGHYVYPRDSEKQPTHEELTDYHINALRQAKILFSWLKEASGWDDEQC